MNLVIDDTRRDGPSLSATSAGKTFASSNAPLLQYLRAFKDLPGREIWSTKAAYEEDVELLRQSSLKDSTLSLSNDYTKFFEEYIRNYPGPFAKIVDISNDSNVSEGASIPRSPDYRTVDADVIDGFGLALRTCSSNVHTRLVLLRRPDIEYFAIWKEKMQAAIIVWRLLCVHILGIELELRPADIEAMLSTTKETSYRPGMLHLHDHDCGSPLSASKVLGKRSLDGGSPHCGRSCT